jgi:hypothetical protein
LDAAKPAKFTSETKWADWAPSFMNYLRTIPGRDGVPLRYVCRDNEMLDPTPNTDFINDYVNMAPLEGKAYAIDSADVHTYIVNFVAGNETAEAKIQSYGDQNDGRQDYIALKQHYKGVGVHALDITKAELVLSSLYYGGEKKPHMWWEEFEKQPTSAFTTYNKREGRVVHSPEMKLRTLLAKVSADFLTHVKASIGIELTRQPITLTYEQALAAFRNEVNRKFPPQMSSATSRPDETSTNLVKEQAEGEGDDSDEAGGTRNMAAEDGEAEAITHVNRKRGRIVRSSHCPMDSISSITPPFIFLQSFSTR